MANISIKKDFEDGQKLFAQQLNNNFETIELGINAGNKLIWKDDNGAEFQTFRGTTEEIENRPIIDGQTLYNIETGEMLLDTEGSRRTINKPLWNDNSTSEVTSFRGTTEEIENRPVIDGQKLYDIENGDTFLDVGETRKVMNKPLWKDDNGAQVQSFRGTAAEVAARPIIDGQTLYNIETGETALDVGNNRISTGAGNVVYIGDEEPQNDATKIWIENDQVLNLGSEVAISSEEPTTQEKVWIQRGKNLFDKNSSIIQGKYLGDNEILNSAVDFYQDEYIKVLPNTSYVLSDSLSGTLRIVQYDETKGYISRLVDTTSGQIAFTTQSTTEYVRLSCNIASLDSIQLEQGSAATPYEPYTPKKIHTKTDNGYEEFYNEEEHNKVNYSTGEQRIGTWIDGKPLYRKVINGTITANANTRSINNLTANCDVCVNIYGMFDVQSSQGYCSINGVRLNADGNEAAKSGVYLVNDTLMLATMATTDRNSALYYAIVEYTKTTD